VTLISASAGSGKTFLLRSWLGETGLAPCAAWVPVPRQELTAAPDLDGWAIVERPSAS
jgi:LuxR family transcriptional regulator, maltose regulon positive regulatory protein